MTQAPQHPGALSEADAPADDPFPLFTRWMAAAEQAGLIEPTAMALASVGSDGKPSLRLVLLKQFDARGFVFYTNYSSRKARELDAHPQAAATVWWDKLERQIRIEGAVQRAEPHEGDDYFAGRPRGSQLGAWASHQSEFIGSRAELERQLAEVSHRFAIGAVPRPPFWGGYRLVPERIEFWQGQPNRLHDRLLYTHTAGAWRRERLQP
ncbi:MAG: pyridoxamine 5'-phosphate oxidase [Nevskiales bacterium]